VFSVENRVRSNWGGVICSGQSGGLSEFGGEQNRYSVAADSRVIRNAGRKTKVNKLPIGHACRKREHRNDSVQLGETYWRRYKRSGYIQRHFVVVIGKNALSWQLRNDTGAVTRYRRARKLRADLAQLVERLQ
jgi:hypothetical protein